MMSEYWVGAQLLQMSGNYWSACALHAAVKLGIFTTLGNTSLSASQISERLSLDERSLTMLLDALTSLELLGCDAGSYYLTKSTGCYLVKGSPDYLGDIIMHHHHLMASWLQLDESIRTGRPVREKISHSARAEEKESFLRGMFNLAMRQAPLIAKHIDLTGSSKLLDLGGGPGTYAIFFCQENPHLKAQIFDLSSTRKIAEEMITNFLLQNQVSFYAGDFEVDPFPEGYDVVWISHILHAEGRHGCHCLLEKAVQNLMPGGKLFVQEFLLEDNRQAPQFPALFSLNMLLGTPQGSAYSESEIRSFLQAVNLADIQRLEIELPNGAGIISSRKPL